MDLRNLDQEAMGKYINEIATPCLNTVKEIFLYTPGTKQNFRGEYFQNELENKFTLNESSNYIITNVSDDKINQMVELELVYKENSIEGMKFGNHWKYEFAFGRGDTLCIRMKGDQNIAHPIVFDIYQEKSPSKNRVRFVVKPRLTETVASLYLYSVVGGVVCIIYFLTFFLSRGLYDAATTYTGKTLKNVLIILAGIGLLAGLVLIWYWIKPAEMIGSYIWYCYLEVLLIGILTLLIIFYEYRKMRSIPEKLKRLEMVNK